MKIRKRPADAVVGDRQLSACVLGLAYDRFWVVCCTAAFRRHSALQDNLCYPVAGIVAIHPGKSLIVLRESFVCEDPSNWRCK